MTSRTETSTGCEDLILSIREHLDCVETREDLAGFARFLDRSLKQFGIIEFPPEPEEDLD